MCVYYTTSNGECNFAIPSKIRGEYRNVSKQFLNFDVGRTECVGQTMFSVMTPVSKKYRAVQDKNVHEGCAGGCFLNFQSFFLALSGETLRTSDQFFPRQNTCFMC